MSAADHSDHAEEVPPAHDQATEVAHAWQHFFSDCRVFAIFLAVIILTVATWNINFGPTGNKFFVFFTATLRCGLIAYYLLSLFKTFSLVKNTFIFCALFLIGMIFLSWWDSELKGIGNPIYNSKDPASMKP
jgi:lipopolysaccharide export LptBFGC system permease protein LptF